MTADNCSEYETRAMDFLANPKSSDNNGLWAIVRSTNANSELNCRVICAAKAELRSRGVTVA